MNIYVGNLSYNLVEDDLKEIFEEYGEVTSVKIITDKMSGKSKGFAFVEMSDQANGLKAIAELNGAEVDNRKIKVNEAKEKEERSSGYKQQQKRRY